MPGDDPLSTIRRQSGGFTLIEVVVAFLLLAFVLTAGIVVFTWQRTRMFEQALWRRAIESVEQEVEAARAIPPSALAPGTGQDFLTTPDAMGWLPNPIARRDIEEVNPGDKRLLSVVVALSWGEEGKRRVSYQEFFLVAR